MRLCLESNHTSDSKRGLGFNWSLAARTVECRFLSTQGQTTNLVRLRFLLFPQRHFDLDFHNVIHPESHVLDIGDSKV